MNLAKCMTCGNIKDCKPAGLNGALVCLGCAKKEPKLLRLFLLRSIGYTEADEKHFFQANGFDAYADESTSKAIGQAACLLVGEAMSKAHEVGIEIKRVESKVVDSDGDTDNFSVTFHANVASLAHTLDEESPSPDPQLPSYPLPGKYDA